jgi:hypothetical protein
MDKILPQGEFKKDRTPTFDGTNKIGQEAKAWLLGMECCFKIHD